MEIDVEKGTSLTYTSMEQKHILPKSQLHSQDPVNAWKARVVPLNGTVSVCIRNPITLVK